MMVLVFRLFYLPPALHWVLLLGLFIHIFLFMYWLILASRSLYY